MTTNYTAGAGGTVMRTGTATLPLHGGKCPRWLFEKMKVLGAAVIEAIVEEYGPAEVLRRLSQPYWFQALGCVLGFDWHSSGVTTTVCGALKEGIKNREKEIGIFICGGKGATSRKTPGEIERFADKYALSVNPEVLVYASRMAAKVDNTALQDSYQLYHHVFVFTEKGRWAVIQQGMNENNRRARRYHWLAESVSDFVCEPHAGVCCDERGKPLNMVARESEECRRLTAELVREKPEKLMREYKNVQNWLERGGRTSAELDMPARHSITHSIPQARNLERTLWKVYDRQPADFKEFLALRGVGPKTVRALVLVSELVYGAKPSFKDPVRYSFAHGGKDGHPYPVDRATYQNSIEVLRGALKAAKIGQSDKLKAFKRLSTLDNKM